MGHKDLVEIAIVIGVVATMALTGQTMLQFGLYRPRDWAIRYKSGKLKTWSRRGPGYGIPLAAAVLLCAIATAVTGPSQLIIVTLAGASVLGALAIGIRDPAWSRPSWLLNCDAIQLENSRGQRLVQVTGTVEICVGVVLFVLVEGWSSATLGVLILGVGGTLGTLRHQPRRNNRS